MQHQEQSTEHTHAHTEAQDAGHAHDHGHAVHIEGLPADADPEVVAALTALTEVMKAKKQVIDVGPELMRQLYHYVKDNNIRPRVVKSKSQAKRMTAKDPDGYRWRVGERYVMVMARR